MSTDQINEIKRLAIIALFSDDELMDRFVLKGGNALDLIHNISPRGSKDIDLSIADEFTDDEFSNIALRIKSSITSTYELHGYTAFDIQLHKRPKHIVPELEFWGGYRIEFKTILTEKYAQHHDDIDSLRRLAIPIAANHSPKVLIDISKGEFCSQKDRHSLEGYTIFVYSPEMLIIEKLRAICQQMPDYGKIISNPSQSARARDFFDIYVLIEHFKPDLNSDININLFKKIFAAKSVPLHFLKDIDQHKDYHESDFPSVQSTIKPDYNLEEYEFYFEYVSNVCKSLEFLRNE